MVFRGARLETGMANVWLSRSVGAERREWIDSRGAPGWDETRQHRDDGEQERDGGVDGRIERPDLVEQRLDQPCCRDGAAETQNEAGRYEPQSAAKDQADDLAGLRPERHPDADFRRAL